MVALDIVIVLVVSWGLWRGFSQGAVRTAVSLLSWLLAVVIATRLSDDLAPFLAGFTVNPLFQMLLGFALIFLVVLIGLQLFVYLINKSLKRLRLDFVDKIAGAVLGAALGLLKVLVVLSVAVPLLMRMPMWQDARLAQTLLPLTPMAKKLVVETAGELWQVINQDES